MIHFCEVGHSIASFPGRSHLNSLNTCSMQTWRVKAWEIWSCVMMSGRQRIDGGRSLMKGLEALVVSIRELNIRALTRQHQYRSSLMMLGMGQGIIMVQHPPSPNPVCLPSVYVMLLRVTRSPEPFHSIYAYCKQSKDRRWDKPGNEAGACRIRVASLEYSCIGLFEV